MYVFSSYVDAQKADFSQCLTVLLFQLRYAYFKCGLLPQTSNLGFLSAVHT